MSTQCIRHGLSLPLVSALVFVHILCCYSAFSDLFCLLRCLTRSVGFACFVSHDLLEMLPYLPMHEAHVKDLSNLQLKKIKVSSIV